MKFHFLLLGFSVLFLASHAFAVPDPCGSPDITIAVSTDKWYEGGSFDVNLTLSADPQPSTTCNCAVGQDCRMEWQYFDDSNNSWKLISKTSVADLNCSNRNCYTSSSWPVEDLTYTKPITCVNQKVYKLRGYQPYTNSASKTKTIYCYPSSQACVPPETGNFNLDQTCHYINVPLFIDGNFNLLSNGHSINDGSDINFFSSGTKYLNIANGGKIDLNKSTLFAGLIIPFESGGALLGGILFVFIFASLFHNRKIIEAMG